MKWEEVVEKLYNEYLKASEKEEKIRRIQEALKELGLEGNVEFNASMGTAIAIISVKDTKLEEIARWLMGDGFRISNINLIVATKEFEKDGLSKSCAISERAEKIGLNYIGYIEEHKDYFLDYFEIPGTEEVKLILVVENYKDVDC